MSTLRYFDLLLAGRGRGDPAAAVFERFVHWGYWPEPSRADGSPGDLAAAVARLDDEVTGAAALSDGQRVLDAGCGFGGTLRAVAGRHRAMTLLGLNLDLRQIRLAEPVSPAGGAHRVLFLQGDACALPLRDRSVDRVLAVECIFHFPSRLAFLREAARVLVPGGILALSDFVTASDPDLAGRFVVRQIARGYGPFEARWPDGHYGAMAAAAGLAVESDRDLTAHTLPTYPALLALIRRGGFGPRSGMAWPTRVLYGASLAGLVRYRLLVLRRR